MALLTPENNGIVHLKSNYGVPETLSRLENLLKARGLTIFARIDHSGAAAGVGMTMPPTEVLVFGSPKSGTPIMLASPATAIDLPLKALAWQDAEGKNWLSYNTPEYLQRRHDFPPELLPNLSGAIPILSEAATGK